MSYERVIQWAAGPFSIICGWLGNQITNHIHLFGSLGIGHSQVGQAIFNSSVFVVGAAVTYAGHHKWLTNLGKWWTTQKTTVTPVATDEATKLREQVKSAGMEPVA